MIRFETVKETAARLKLSERRIEALAREGRIPGAILLSGSWIMPDSSTRPAALGEEALFDFDAEGNYLGMKNPEHAEGQKTIFDFMEGHTLLNLEDAADYMNLSRASMSNWIRAGRVTPALYSNGKPMFHKDDLAKVLSEIQMSGSRRLKSRRNKSQIAGTNVYRDYLTDEEEDSASCERAADAVLEIMHLAEKYPDSEVLIPFILAEYTLRGLVMAGRLPKTLRAPKTSLLKKYLLGELAPEITPYEPLMEELLWQGKEELTPELRDAFSTSGNLLDEIRPIHLPYLPGLDVLGLLYLSLRSMKERKMSGMYYTPTRLVRILTQASIAHSRGSFETVLDPCCGTGNFLMDLVLRGIPASRIYGQDNDPVSVALARINLAFLCEEEEIPGIVSRIRICDTLLEPASLSSYDLIIGNPPWGYSIDQKSTRLLSRRYRTASGGNIESFRLFLEFALLHLGTSGMLSFVLPESFLSVASHGAIRQMVGNRCRLQYVAFFPDAFEGVSCPSILLVASASEQVLTDRLTGKNTDILIETPDDSYLIRTPRGLGSSEPWNLQTRDEAYALLEALENYTPAIRLESSADFALGIVTGDNDRYLSPEPLEGYEPILRGSDLVPFGYKKPAAFIRYTPSAFQQVANDRLYRAKEKLIYRFIGNRPVFAYDNTGILTLNSANIVIPWIPSVSMQYILGILNSEVTRFYLQESFHSLKLLRSHIEHIPLPLRLPEEQQPLIDIVEELTELQKKLTEREGEISPEEKKTLTHAYEDAFNRLNAEVCRLFGLTPEQRSMLGIPDTP